MSESREQSYYEIALTNRQVMSIFVVLLVCLLASFVSGVWIGRQGSPRVATADAQRIEGESGADEAPLGEMDFFSGRGAEPASTASIDTGSTPPAEPPADPAATTAAPKRTATRPRAEPPPAARRADPEPPPSARRADPEPAPATAAPPRAATPAAPTAATAPSDEFLYIQVFSGLDREQAQSIVERLRAGGYAAFLSSVEVDSRVMHRVRIGPYSEREEAEGVAGTVQREFKLSTWITP